MVCRLFMVREYWWYCLRDPPAIENERRDALNQHAIYEDLQLDYNEKDIARWQQKLHEWTANETSELTNSLENEQEVLKLLKELNVFHPELKEKVEHNPFISPIAAQGTSETNFALEIRFAHIPAMLVKRFSKATVSDFTRKSIIFQKIDINNWESELTGELEIFMGLGKNVTEDRLLIRNKLLKYCKKEGNFTVDQ